MSKFYHKTQIYDIINSMKITDCHVHCSPEISPEELAMFLKRTNTDSAVIQAVAHSKKGPLVPIAFEMRRLFPETFYVFGAPNRDEYFKGSENLGLRQREYIRKLIDEGMDGIKMLEGKPQMRKAVPIPDFDDMCWEPFFKYVEEEQIPMMWHVNDPEKNWSGNASPWLVKQGWAYDETFINNEEQYRQVLQVLENHPGIKAVFAHFFFMSGQLERLSAILDKYKNVMVDLTPGIEMYENFSVDPETTKAFFDKYHDRICYGTDIGGRCILTNEGMPFNEKECERRPKIVRHFLEGKEEALIESDGNFLVDRDAFVMKPLGLTGTRLEEIMGENIRKIIGHNPK